MYILVKYIILPRGAAALYVAKSTFILSVLGAT